MLGTAGQVRKIQLLQQRADIALRVFDAEAILDHALKVDTPPAHDPVCIRIGAGLYDLRQFCLLIRRQTGSLSAAVNVLQPIRAASVETVNPVTKGLAIHIADPSRIGAVHAVQDRSQ